MDFSIPSPIRFSMRLPLLCLALLTLLSVCVLGAVVTREAPSSVYPGETFDVTLIVDSAVPQQLFTVEETLPAELDILDWTVEGAVESKQDISTRNQDNGFGWSFTPAGEKAKVRYTAKVSKQASTGETLRFEAVYFDPNGFNRAEGALSVVEAPPPSAASPSTSETPSTSQQASLQKKSSNQAPAGGSQKTRPSGIVGMLIIAGIIVIGSALFYYFTRPKKSASGFDDAFFKKK